jgi:phi13 family phage major tail protein
MNEAPRIGLDEVHIARVISDDANGIVYDTPIALKGAVNATVNPNSDVATDYGDNGVFFVTNNRGNTEMTLELIDVDSSVLALMLGQKKVNGITVEAPLDQSPYFAVGFRVWIAGEKDGEKRYQYFWYAKGKFSVPETGGSTKTESIEFGHINLTAQFAQTIYNGIICTHARSDDDEVSSSVITNWFSAPVTSVASDDTALTVVIAESSGKVTFTGTKASGEDFVFTSGSIDNGITIGVLDSSNNLLEGTYTVNGNVITFTPASGTPATAFVTGGLKDNNGVGATPKIETL